MNYPRRFQDRFGLRYPLVQAPTGSIAGPELCAAVCNAGAMGGMGLTWTPPTDAANQVRQVRAATPRPFLVNYALHFAPHSLPGVLDAGAPIVLFSWGDPAPHVPQVRQRGAAWGVQVTSAAGARRAVDLGADFLVCQGVEAGGHVQASRSLWDLLPSLLDPAGQTPLLAAGGIADGASWARALHAGASGVVMGTRFVATRESAAHRDYKAQIVGAGGDDTTLTVCFDGGWPQAAHRVLHNRTLADWEAAGSPPVGQRPGEGDVVARSASGAAIVRYEDTAPRHGMTGDIEAMCLYAGTGCGQIDDVPAVGELIPALWGRCEAALPFA